MERFTTVMAVLQQVPPPHSGCLCSWPAQQWCRQTHCLYARAVRSLTRVFSALLHAAFKLRPSYLIWLNRFEVQPLIHSYAGSSCHTGLMKLQPSLARSPSCLPSRQPSLVEQPILEVTWWQFLQRQFFGDKREVGFYIRLESSTNLVTAKVHCKSSWWT